MGIGGSKTGDNFDAGVRRNVGLGGGVSPLGRWRAECYAEGATEHPKWVEEWENLVTTEGANEILLATLSGAANSTIWYIGLKSTGAFVVGDTAASHAGWTELTTQYADPRKTWAATSSSVSAGSVSNSTSVASFSITSSGNCAGAFLTSASSLASALGVLYAVGEFAAEKDLAASDTLEVTATFTAVTSSG
jgi:hypothetical protein